EVTIERRPITDPNASMDIEIREDSIRIPIMAEEAVVEKRVVGMEEVTLRKQQITETETVEEDLRKERLDVDRTQDHLSATRDSMTGTEESGRDAGHGSKSLGDRIKDGIDDVKDRMGGDRSSR
ncbi:MAG TPA: YsnF/AvaK domain-containing protein, partial [Gemmatimonadaceae bacterium]|nr:YsnF/AvaK domain-containing protein [Gemmatimonadaceae bacterium]